MPRQRSGFGSRVVVVMIGITARGAALGQTEPAAPADARASTEFSRFVDEYFTAMLRFSPSDATSHGLHDLDDRLEDRSRGRVEERIGELKAQLTALGRFDRARLTPAETIDAEILDGQIRSELLSLETLQRWRTDPMTYASLPGSAVDALIKRSFAPAADRLRLVLARERAIPRLLDQGRANLAHPPRVFTELAVRMARGAAGFFETSVAVWARDAAGGDTSLRRDFEQVNAEAVRALRAFGDWLETDLLPRSDGAYALGEETYRALLRHEEMIDLPLADLLARGERQLRRDHDAFVATARRIDPDRSPAEVVERLSLDHPTAQELVPTIRRSIEETRRFVVEREFATIPSEVRPRIEETPPYARAGTFASMDTPGAFETRATEAYYYVTPVEPDWTAEHQEEHLRAFSRPLVAIVNVHEAYPGHYLQFLYAPRYPTKTRKFVVCHSNVEGWAHYTEQAMVDAGFGDGDARIRLAQLQDALLRDCRYIVSIKLHTAGWTVEQGAKFFEEFGFQEPANALAEARRGTYNPSYLAYTFGKLEILALRDEFLARTGKPPRAFHDAFLEQGGIPLPLVRRILLPKP